MHLITDLNWPEDLEIGTTFFPRKIAWELTGNSEWMENLPVIEDSIKLLAEHGVGRMRLVVVNFESDYWERIDTMLKLFKKYEVSCDLCVGPVDYPYGPAGVRLPKFLEGKISSNIHLSLQPSGIRDWALDFTKELFQRYGKSKLIDRFYIGNEWPDRHLIEGTHHAMTIGEDFMLEVIKIAQKYTKKKLVLNTNIHPSKQSRLLKTFSNLFSLLGKQGVIGLDSYPTEEKKDFMLRLANRNYGLLINKVQELFPKAVIEFTEAQAEPWPKKLTGLSWFEIIKNNLRLVENFYLHDFRKSFETHLTPSKISKVNFWGAPLWLVAYKHGYKLPLQLISTFANSSQ